MMTHSDNDSLGQIRALDRQGLSTRSIAAALGLSQSKVSRTLRKYRDTDSPRDGDSPADSVTHPAPPADSAKKTDSLTHHRDGDSPAGSLSHAAPAPDEPRPPAPGPGTADLAARLAAAETMIASLQEAAKLRDSEIATLRARADPGQPPPPPPAHTLAGEDEMVREYVRHLEGEAGKATRRQQELDRLRPQLERAQSRVRHLEGLAGVEDAQRQIAELRTESVRRDDAHERRLEEIKAERDAAEQRATRAELHHDALHRGCPTILGRDAQPAPG